MRSNDNRSVIEYSPLTLPLVEGFSPEAINSYLHQVSLSCQGSSVIVSEIECSPLQLAIAFKTLLLLSSEIIIKLNSGHLILLTSHIEGSPIRNIEVDVRLLDIFALSKRGSTLYANVANPLPRLTIDLAEIYRSTHHDGVENEIDDAGMFIDALERRLTPAHVIELQGEVPLLILFVALYCAFTQTKSLLFKHNGDTVHIS
jgi:hypothetical protein